MPDPMEMAVRNRIDLARRTTHAQINGRMMQQLNWVTCMYRNDFEATPTEIP